MNEAASVKTELNFSRLFETTQARNIPISAVLELTHECNLRCRHCYIVKPDRPALGTSAIFSIIDELAQAGTLFLAFTGGEVLLREDFFDIAEYAKRKRFALTILTNGTKITPEIAGRLKQLNPLAVSISIYSHRPETHDDFTRCDGAFARSIGAIRLLVGHGINVDMKSCVLKINQNDLEGLLELGRQLKCSVKFDPVITPKNDGGRAPIKYALDQDELIEFFKKMSHSDSVAGTRRPDPANSSFCRAGRDIIAISPFGDVFPCLGFPKTMGSLRARSLAEVWRSEALRDFRRQSTIANVKKCRECELLVHCNHCIGIDYVANQTFALPSEINCGAALAKKAAS